jgi:hypothetical protein
MAPRLAEWQELKGPESLTHVWGDTRYLLPDKDLRQALVRGPTSCDTSSQLV